MNRLERGILVVIVLSIVALAGVLLSFSAPYIKSDDELVYLTGALQVQEGTLPDADMLKGYAYGPYLYPLVMSWWYETLGHDTFKSIALILLILGTGGAAYLTFRMLWLPFVPALTLAVVALLPRVSAGTEFFGVLTFHEAIGRSFAVPLFFLVTAILVRRFVESKPLWPVYAVTGFFLFLHPVTVMLFAFVSLCTILVIELVRRVPFFQVVGRAIISGLVFMAAGSYFFVDVVIRLLQSVASDGVPAALYVEAVVFRNQWEFPAASFDWFKHMAVVSIFFIIAIIAFYAVPYLKRIRRTYLFPQARLLVLWGAVLAILSLLITILLPGANLYLMQHADASYVFQQWSRMSKFYYLGVFIAFVPTAYILWKWYVDSRSRSRYLVAVLIIAAALASSSVAFELLQFVARYPNYERAYVPQALSHISDDSTAEEYRETCGALKALGIPEGAPIVSHDFGLRYYCRADLYTTGEEGAAYLQHSRKELVAWYEGYLTQRDALREGDSVKMADFARAVGARAVVLEVQPKYEHVESDAYWQVTRTAAHIILVPQAR